MNNTLPLQQSSTATKTKVIQTPYDYHQLICHFEEAGQAYYGKHFQVQEKDRPLILKLMAYFLRDEAIAANEALNLNKGILLMGPIGCGKTSLITLLRALCNDIYRPHMVSCREVTFEFSRNGFDAISKYSSRAFFPYSDVPRVHCFDDLGLETNITFWGNNCNVMAEILLSRYDLFVAQKMLTHVTTNLNSQELEAIYGNRLRSRMRAMFNLVAFEPDSTDKRR
ncbi:P-loop NTPase family protein [Chitinophaga vietnamensis]|uniref:ATPase n=1 Tax=Chitinophaga vietnamensis TaxID=2593957 RepID=UPI001178C93D|nr:ATPase [Chitinophaga vietnamensis]